MPLNYMAGHARSVREGVNDLLRQAFSENAPAILLVPAQFTLQAERDALTGLGLEGSFDLMVLSPERLCTRVFEATGYPREARIDEQGRIMLIHAAAERLKGELAWYKRAVSRPGFAECALAQISAFKQSGLTPEDIAARAEAADESLSKKLSDLALLFGAYERALAGRYMDGDDEQRRAAERLPGAKFLARAHVIVHGFELVTTPLIGMMLALAQVGRSVTLALPLGSDEGSPDAHLFSPVRRSLARLIARARDAGMDVTRIDAPYIPAAGAPAIRFLEHALFSAPAPKLSGAPEGVHLALLKNPTEEAEHAALMARHLARTRGYRYRDIGLVCLSSDDAAMDTLKRAFALAEVPLFLAAGRSAEKHPLSMCVLSALRALSGGFETEDLEKYMRSGFSTLTDDEADVLVNYAISHALTGRRWREPLVYGSDEEREAAEPLRQRVMAPLIALRERMRGAKTTRARLSAVYDLLSDVNAYDTIESTRLTLESHGLNSWAMEGAQVWKKILDALDQMDELLGEELLSVKAIYELLRRALSQAVVKALPQSADAVEGGGPWHLKGKPVKVLLIVGASDAQPKAPVALLSEAELGALGDRIDVLTEEERARMARINLKGILSLTDSFLLVTRPMSDESGRALEPGALMSDILRLLPDAKVEGGVSGSARIEFLRFSEVHAALARMGSAPRTNEARAAMAALESMPDQADALSRLRLARAHRVYSESLSPALTKSILIERTVSASRLEEFAACPFKYFAHYGLRPEEFKPFELSARDVGTFYHESLEAFVRGSGEALGTRDERESMRAMDEITDGIAERMKATSALNDALGAHELDKLRSVARRAAAIISRQFEGSKFSPIAVEADLLKNDVRLKLDAQTTVSGRIDRIDRWADGGKRYLRVIDYKVNGQSVDLNRLFHGLELQLMIYLAAVLTDQSGHPAGAFYFNISDPLVETDSLDEDAIEVAREQALRMDGLVLGDEQVIGAMAAKPELSIRVKFRADGTLAKNDNALTEADFDALIRHALDKARAYTSAIRAGDTSIAPVVYDKRSACDYCEHRTLCQFDELLGAHVRAIKKQKPAVLLAQLRASAGEPEERP